MSDIFEVGDVVYHPMHGKGFVRSKNDEYISVEFDLSPPDVLFCVESASKILSFSAWPSPNHTRPVKNGVYKVSYVGRPWVLCYLNSKWFFVDSQFTHMLGDPVSNQDKVENLEFLYCIK